MVRWKNLLQAQVGPRIDTRYMWRAQLFRSALQFAMIGAVAAGLLLVMGRLADRAPRGAEENPIVIALAIAFGAVAVSSVVASVWLSLIGLFRRADYDPDAVREADDKRLEEHLARGCRL